LLRIVIQISWPPIPPGRADVKNSVCRSDAMYGCASPKVVFTIGPRFVGVDY